jgi:hypothetical protein
MITNSLATFRTEITNLLTQHHQQNTSRPISAPTPLGAKIPSGLPGLLQSPSNPILNVSGAAPSNPIGTPNDYDKAVEVEQRKLCDPILTPAAIRAWKLVFDVYAKNPNRRMSMYEAFGTQSMRSLMIMFPDELIPMDDASFEYYINKKFLTTTHLFSEIKLAVSKNTMKKDLP